MNQDAICTESLCPLSTTVAAGRPLLETVVSGGYCIGCGVCAALDGSPMAVEMDEYGRYQAVARAGAVTRKTLPLLDVCPFSGAGPNEDEIAQGYSSTCRHDSRIGYYQGLYAGYVQEQEFRARGASGGLATWLLHELLRKGLVDAVIHVQPTTPQANGRPLFRYAVSRSLSEVLEGAKSRYYPVELSRVLAEVRNRPGRYALIGLPCFIKAVKLLGRQEPWVTERIQYYVGLVCGHLKSAAFAEAIAWQLGVEPNRLREIDFRKKLHGRPASEYGVEVIGAGDNDKVSVVRPMRGLVGDDWGQCLFMYYACDYCDDVFAETADVAVGDAWLPRYTIDSMGTNVVVVRHPEICRLLTEAALEGRLHLEPLTPDEVAQSQEGALRHRREGLAYRLYLKQRVGEWYPRKRVTPGRDHLTRRRRRVYELRSLIARESHEAFRAARAASDFAVFQRRMAPYLRQYRLVYRPWWQNWAGFLARCLRLLTNGRNPLGSK